MTREINLVFKFKHTNIKYGTMYCLIHVEIYASSISIQPFREATGYKGKIYTDESKDIYEALGCKNEVRPGKLKGKCN